MIGETYPFLTEAYIPDTDILFYTFLSQSDEMVIPKAVAFIPIEKGGQKYYNWGFGDLVINPQTGEYTIDDKTESNNGDMKTVFYTVVSTLTLFFDIHPGAIVHIEGSNQQRTGIYRGLIARHWRQIEPFYQVFGFIDGKMQVFRNGVEYEYVLISRKAVVNL